jgi:GNAT superfamily N-acetyltransferase
MQYEIIEKLPTAEEYRSLRALVGWGLHDVDVIERAMPNSLYGVCAYVDGVIVGMARVIGDGGLTYYVQDVIVHPGYQRRGIGTRIMDRVMAYIAMHAAQNSVVGLMAATGKEPFYEKYGFTRRPNEHLGSGMTIFWKQKRD